MLNACVDGSGLRMLGIVERVVVFLDRGMPMVRRNGINRYGYGCMELVEIGVWILELMMSIMSVMIFLDFFLLSFGLALSVFSLIFFISPIFCFLA